MRANMGIVASGQTPPVTSFAFDAKSNPTGTSTGPAAPTISWTHTPVGVPKGVLVFTATENSASDVVTSITYGGVTMTEITGSPLSRTINAEVDWAHGYFLGSSLPTGAQTVEITVVAGYASFNAAAFTVTGPNNSAIEDTSTTNAGTANPTCALTIANDSFCAGVLLSGQLTTADVTPGAAMTQALEVDTGSMVCNFARKTDIATANTSLDWTAVSEEHIVLAAAIKST